MRRLWLVALGLSGAHGALMSRAEGTLMCRKEDRTYSTEMPKNGSYTPWSIISSPSNTGKQYITIVNLTPHRFKLDDTHSYQMVEFDFDDIPQGRARQNTAHYTDEIGANPVDTNGEAYYSIEGTDKKFVIRATTHIPDKRPGRTVIDLSGMGMGQREYINPAREVPVTLVITGSISYGFITSIRHGPGNWMRSIYPIIKDRSIQHLVMPGTHDSGMSTISNKIRSLGSAANTQTQGISIYDQLRAGARWFDLRVGTVHSDKGSSFWVLHVNDPRADIAIGNSGVSLDDVVADINRFTDENPGEVFFFSLRYLVGIREQPRNGPIYWDKNLVEQFFSKLRAVKNRCPDLDPGVKFNKQKASYFMDRNDGRGCAVFMLSDRLEGEVPQDSVSDGIYQGSRMDVWDNWSNRGETEAVAKDQAAKWNTVGRGNGSDNDKFLIGQWIVSADIFKTTAVGIERIAVLLANAALYWKGVNNMSPEHWPNVMLVDYIGVVVAGQYSWGQLSAELYTLAIGMNLYMVSENCNVSAQRSPLLRKPSNTIAATTWPAAQWNGIIYANGTVQDDAPETLDLGQVEVLKNGTVFRNGTVLESDVANPQFGSTRRQQQCRRSIKRRGRAVDPIC